jgi:L,D-peptidoglycan transpeptidase YkuD (ErfK/YbiS/YcfS/YnhG family)
VLVTSNGMSTPSASLRRYERAGPEAAWRALGPAEPALIGRHGMGWSFAFRDLARGTEPIKVDGDKKLPAGLFRIGSNFGFGAAQRRGDLQIREGTVCVDDPASPAYNTISTRQKVGWKVHGENMWRVSSYRRGLLIDYPTSRERRGGSCIFIHVRLPTATGTNGCVALPEQRLLALQDFSSSGAVLAVLPQHALRRLGACLPDPAAP